MVFQRFRNFSQSSGVAIIQDAAIKREITELHKGWEVIVKSIYSFGTHYLMERISINGFGPQQ